MLLAHHSITTAGDGPDTIFDGPDNGVRIVRRISAYNPNASAVTGVIQWHYDATQERIIRRNVVSMAATGDWQWGEFWGYWHVPAGVLVKFLPDSWTATWNPIEWGIDYAEDA